MSEAVVLTDVDDRGVATITLNRPEVFNGYNEEMIAGLIEACARLGADDGVRVVVLRGAGKHFSAGADVNWFREVSTATPEVQKRSAEGSTAAMRGLYELPKPTIALVHNACMGGGTGYAAACDVVIASEDAKFSISEVVLGLTPAPILPQLAAAIGLHALRRYAISGERFDAREAHRIGLVHEVCPVGGLDAAAAPVIEAFLAAAPEAVRETKRLVREIGGAAIDDSRAEEIATVAAAGRGSKEGREGFAAFLEKRKPAWYPEKE